MEGNAIIPYLLSVVGVLVSVVALYVGRKLEKHGDITHENTIEIRLLRQELKTSNDKIDLVNIDLSKKILTLENSKDEMREKFHRILGFLAAFKGLAEFHGWDDTDKLPDLNKKYDVS